MKTPKKFGIVFFLRDWKESFNVVQKDIMKVMRLHKTFTIHDEEFNPGDDNIYTVLTNFKNIESNEKMRTLIEDRIFNLLDVESDENNIIWFDSVMDLESIVEKAEKEQREQEEEEEKDYKDLIDQGKKGENLKKKYSKELSDYNPLRPGSFAKMYKKYKLPERSGWSIDTASEYLALRELGLRK